VSYLTFKWHWILQQHGFIKYLSYLSHW